MGKALGPSSAVCSQMEVRGPWVEPAAPLPPQQAELCPTHWLGRDLASGPHRPRCGSSGGHGQGWGLGSSGAWRELRPIHGRAAPAVFGGLKPGPGQPVSRASMRPAAWSGPVPTPVCALGQEWSGCLCKICAHFAQLPGKETGLGGRCPQSERHALWKLVGSWLSPTLPPSASPHPLPTALWGDGLP